jgi:isocitrate/isopropylmalate dehydrogenase
MADKKNVKDILKVDKENSLSTIKELLEDEFNQIVVEQEFNREILIKDYYITIMLFLMNN